MTDTTNPQARRDRYAAAIREAEGWVLDGGQHMTDAVMAVADAEQAELGAELDAAGEAIANLTVQNRKLEDDLAKLREVLRTENERANSAIDRETTTEEAEEEHRLALSQTLGLGTGAPWDAIRDRAAELADAVPVSGPGGAADETQQPVPVDRAAIEAAALRKAADRYATLADQNEAYDRERGDLDEAARTQHEAVRDVAIGLRRMADEVQQSTSCSARPCNDAADELCDAHAQIRYHALGEHTFCDPDCDGEQPAVEPAPPVEPVPPVEHCIHDRTVHRTRHKQAPVTGCPWCTTAAAEGPTP
jgi:hypothetical protein